MRTTSLLTPPKAMIITSLTTSLSPPFKVGGIITLILLLTITSLCAQNKDHLKSQIQFLEQIKDSYEGYQSDECKNTISYHSLRNDVTEGLLTRATDGTMAIEWQTQPIPNYFKNDGAWFVWIAALDITEKKVNFDVFVDGVKRFTIPSGNNTSWILTNPDGGILKYQHFDTDQHGDSHGYMTLFAPKNWLKSGNPLSIKIVGEAAGDNTWIIVFKAGDIIPFLKKTVEIQSWLDLIITKTKKTYEVKIIAPQNKAGEQLSYQSGNQKGNILLKREEELSVAFFSINKDFKKHSLSISDKQGELSYLTYFKKDTVIRKLLPEAILINEISISKNIIQAKSKRIYSPKTVKSILKLSNSKLSKGKMYLMNSSHQDIAWMDSPEKCILVRDTMLITPLLGIIKSNPDYRFDIEDALMIKEYIHRHPGQKETIRQMLQKGQIACGANYTQPYEEMYSGEALIRQFYFGRKWLKDEFNYNATVYWNEDVPGRTLQMSQILKKSGVDYMMISRHKQGVFKWFSPDGSYVTTYSPGHYMDAYTPLHKNFYEAAEYLATSAMDWEEYYSETSPQNIIPVFSDADMSPAKEYNHIIKQWESISELTNKQGEEEKISLPSFKIATAQEFLHDFVLAADSLPSIIGERPALWLYIHGPTHQKAIKASREADILLTMAEKFASIDALTENTFVNYPEKRLQKAWEAKIYPDHGWGGKNGQITDDLFRRKFEFARSEAEQILENACGSIASKIQTNPKKGIPLIVFNSLNWNRTEITDFEINFDEGIAKSFEITDVKGKKIPSQYVVSSTYPNGSIQTVKGYFLAENIPSIGYKTYYIKVLSKDKNNKTEPFYENDFYKIKFGDGGLKSIYDKSLEVELIDDAKFAAGEVFAMQSTGTGAGEFAAIQQPTMENFDQTGKHTGEWISAESGEVFSSWTKRTKLPYAEIEQKIILYHKNKKIDFEIAILNWEGVLYREFRMALPLKMQDGNITYEVPFGVVEVGKDEMEGVAGERYNVPAKDLHPRGIENWIGASNKTFGATLSSSVAVADYIDPTDNKNPCIILQPILLASRRSCHGEGNEYLQTGNHYFTFSLNSHQPAWQNGFQSGKQANEKLFLVVNPKMYANANLPQEKCFFSIKNNNIIISTIKKAEDDNSLIIRLYDIKGVNSKLNMNSDLKFTKAISTNLIEEEIKETSIKNKVIKHNSIETIKFTNPNF